MASAHHWDQKESYLASTGVGGGGKHMCGVPPQITQRWLFSVEDRYSHICFINFIAVKTLGFGLWTLIASVAVLQPEYCLSELEMKSENKKMKRKIIWMLLFFSQTSNSISALLILGHMSWSWSMPARWTLSKTSTCSSVTSQVTTPLHVLTFTVVPTGEIPLQPPVWTFVSVDVASQLRVLKLAAFCAGVSPWMGATVCQCCGFLIRQRFSCKHPQHCSYWWGNGFHKNLYNSQ